jgi:hypothetical protein
MKTILGLAAAAMLPLVSPAAARTWTIGNGEIERTLVFGSSGLFTGQLSDLKTHTDYIQPNQIPKGMSPEFSFQCEDRSCRCTFQHATEYRTFRWPLGWSPDGRTLIFEHDLADRWRWGFFQLDLQSFTKTAFLEAPGLRLLSANLSNSGQWITFDGDNGENSSVFAAPVRKGPVPKSECINIAFGARELRPHFSRDDKLIFFTSERDGFRCIWAQRLGSDMHPAGAPFGVYHLHQPRRTVGYLAVGPAMIAFDLRERTGDIWILEPAKSRIK